MRGDMRTYPPAWFLMSILLMIGLHLLVPDVRWLPTPWNYSGVLFILWGIAVCIVAVWLFNKRKTSVNPFAPTTVLVTDGPYRFSRNSMYLGMVLCLVGVGLLQGTLIPFLVIPAFIWIITTSFIRQEEQDLADQFGDEYLDYKNRVRRWL